MVVFRHVSHPLVRHFRQKRDCVLPICLKLLGKVDCLPLVLIPESGVLCAFDQKSTGLFYFLELHCAEYSCFAYYRTFFCLADLAFVLATKKKKK